MIYSGHQVSFFPWIGFWKKIYDSDYFDISIYEQFTKRTWIHYTYIGRKDELVKWKLPIEKEYIDHQTRYSVKDVKVKKNFAEGMLQKFYEVHHRDKYFEYIYPLLCEWMQSVEKLENLWLINFVLVEKVYNFLQLETKLAVLPNLDDNDDASTKIVKQAEMLKCDTYLSGPHGVNYLNMSAFDEKNIRVEFQDTKLLYEAYPQSIISLLSEYGIVKVLELLKS